MMRYFILLSFLFSSLVAQAHQPDLSSTMLVEQKDGSWILQIRAALTAFEYEVHTSFGKDSYSTPEEFQELVIRHITDNLTIEFEGQKIAAFQSPYVKLGHETNTIFKVLGIPKTFNAISVKNSSFKDINRNQSALIILKEGFKKEQFILNNENQHTADLVVKDSKFVLISKRPDNLIQKTPWYLYAILVGAIIAILIVLLRKRNKA